MSPQDGGQDEVTSDERVKLALPNRTPTSPKGFVIFVPGKLMAALAYCDYKILARKLLLRPSRSRQFDGCEIEIIDGLPDWSSRTSVETAGTGPGIRDDRRGDETYCAATHGRLPLRYCQRAIVLAAIKDKPFGWPRKARPSLTATRHDGAVVLRSGRKNGSAGVKQKNGRKSSFRARAAINFPGTKNRNNRGLPHQTPWWCLILGLLSALLAGIGLALWRDRREDKRKHTIGHHRIHDSADVNSASRERQRLSRAFHER